MPQPSLLQKIDKLSACVAAGVVPSRSSRRIDRKRHQRYGTAFHAWRFGGDESPSELVRALTRWFAAAGRP